MKPRLVVVVFGFVFLVIGMGSDGLLGIGLLLCAMVTFVVAIVMNVMGKKNKTEQ